MYEVGDRRDAELVIEERKGKGNIWAGKLRLYLTRYWYMHIPTDSVVALLISYQMVL